MAVETRIAWKLIFNAFFSARQACEHHHLGHIDVSTDTLQRIGQYGFMNIYLEW